VSLLFLQLRKTLDLNGDLLVQETFRSLVEELVGLFLIVHIATQKARMVLPHQPTV